MVELKQWTILIALFSQHVPPSRVCYCRTGGYVGLGAIAEPAESEHSHSNNLKFCVVILGEGAYKGQKGVWTLAAGVHTKYQITRSAQGM